MRLITSCIAINFTSPERPASVRLPILNPSSIPLLSLFSLLFILAIYSSGLASYLSRAAFQSHEDVDLNVSSFFAVFATQDCCGHCSQPISDGLRLFRNLERVIIIFSCYSLHYMIP